MEDEYNVNEYTDEQLFRILDLNNPSDRELEAKILSMVRKYSTFGNTPGDKLSQFFIDIYNRFFENNEDATEQDSSNENEKEGFTSTILSDNQKTNELFKDVKPENILSATSSKPNPENGVLGTANMGNKVTPSKENVQLTKPLDFAKDSLNPLLKQTIKRIISIDSQYRNQQTNSPSTKFTFDLSEPLKDVVSLSLYSVQIPYTWYTVNSDFGGNFFYLKGNAIGITDGNHDYKIEIPSGNYAPYGLATAINLSIQTMLSIYTDVSFGETKAIYNNGVNDSNSGTGKCALQIDITKIYNEGNYTLHFNNWSSPVENALTPLDATERLKTIAGYLGFNNTDYYCNSIYSYPFFSTSLKNTIYPIKNVITSFKIIPYVGNSYLTATAYYTPIIIELNLNGITQTTITNMVSILNNAVKNNNNLDSQFTGCELIDISGSEYTGNGKSYVHLKCKLNNAKSPIVRNLKLAAVFAQDPNGSLFFGSYSFYAFSELIKDSSYNVICELNELLAETPILQSSYESYDTKLQFICDINNGPYTYDNSYNNLTVSVPNNINYTLNTFINAVTSSFNSSVHTFIDYIEPTRDFAATISFYSDISSILNIKPKIENIYNNTSYKIYATNGIGKIKDIFGISAETISDANTANLVYNNLNYSFSSVSFNASDVIYIVPDSSGNKTANTFEIHLYTLNAYSKGAELANYLNDKIANYNDPITGLYPLSGSNVTYNVNTGFTLNLSIELNINQVHYKLLLTGAPTDVSRNVWDKLSFNPIYNLVDFSNIDYVISSNSPIKDNEIVMFDGSNNTFSLLPSKLVNVFNTSGNKYEIPIHIEDTKIDGTGTKYAITDLLNTINNQFANTIANGTTFSTFTLSNGQTFVKVRFNVNQVFTTSDYNLVFYDPYSFTTCFSNTSKNTSTSIQNATWDTTLGWLLGFRSEISFALSEYVNIKYNRGTTNPSIYYLNESSNVCTLIGDTNTSTNLYNYFLIMLDDYVQNHLNDGLITITTHETSVSHAPFVNVCDPVTGAITVRPADYGSPGITYTAQQLYSFNKQVQSQMVKEKSYSKGPFVKDIFGLIPVKTPTVLGSVYVEFGGTLQNQQRLYFGPVNIHRMTVQLLNDRGNLVDLNNANWSFSFVCEQLYKSGVS